ncbi:MAG: nucleoside monophosphate kinase [Gammaproteobacteria bacterium]|nr:nucleoside monophosphate kinase [Gammaproteobacteria bacterium]
MSDSRIQLAEQKQEYTRKIDGITFIDITLLEKAVEAIPAKDKLRQKMIRSGVEFWDSDKTIVKKPVVAISTIGSFLVSLENTPPGMIRLRMGNVTTEPFTLENIREGLRNTMGAQSFHTYMNPQGKTARALYDVTVKHGHFSVAHADTLGIYALGISHKAELELDVQRDLVHLARETSARTSAQDDPTLVAMTQTGATASKFIRQQIVDVLKTFSSSGNVQDWREERNSLFPLSGTVSIGINGSIRNLSKLVADIAGSGKELEYRNILALLNDSLYGFFPEMFKPTHTYGHVFSVDQPAKRAILLFGAPGVGKSTQTEYLVKQIPGAMCVSTGNLARRLQQKIADLTPLNEVEKKAAESLDRMKQGKLMDDQAIYALLTAHFAPGGEGHETYAKSHTVILDGVIKTTENIAAFDNALATFNAQSGTIPMSISGVINLVATEHELMTRFESRVKQATQAGQAQRPDDNIAIYRERLAIYTRNQTPVTEYYRQHSDLFTVDTSQGIEKTTAILIDTLEKCHVQVKAPASSSREANPSSIKPPLLAMPDKLVLVSALQPIPLKSKSGSLSLRTTVITNNAAKFKEFDTQLGDGYGMDVTQCTIADGQDTEEALQALCTQIMANQAHSPHFILREETILMSADHPQEDLTHVPVNELAERKLKSVLHISRLRAYKPQWSENKTLQAFTLRTYEKRSYGYITPNKKSACKYGFGWDAIFVNAATGLTNEEFFQQYGKKSARQHTISDFIETYLRYKALKMLQHHHLSLTRPIDFGENYFHLSTFTRTEKHLSNPHVTEWGIDKLRNAMINEGLFVKASWSRPVKNYFSPPFSGLPLTAKKDEAEETIFMTHDILHHLICDLICDVENPLAGHFNVYSAWRMASEACTLVLADMFYADGLVKSGVDKSCVDKRIYPLFEAIKRTQNIPDPVQVPNEAKMAFIKSLLSANVRYALLGDDAGWRALLSCDGIITEENIACLEAYKNHFGKFFIGDNAWTRANFDNMQKHGDSLQKWVANVGRDTFRRSNIPLLSDVHDALIGQQVKVHDYSQIVDTIFEFIFETKIKPHLSKEKVAFEPDSVLQSRAFRRFLMGQVSLFERYPVPLNMGRIRERIYARLKNEAVFSPAEQEELRLSFEQYILGLEGLRLMSKEEAMNARDCSSVFPPVYISYPDMQKQYKSIENCVKDRIAGYAMTTSRLGAHRNSVFVLEEKQYTQKQVASIADAELDSPRIPTFHDEPVTEDRKATSLNIG